MRPFWTGPLVLLTQAALLVIFGRIFSPGVSPLIWWILMIALELLCAAADAILFFTLRRLAQKEQTEERERLLAESLDDQEKRAREWEESEKQAAASAQGSVAVRARTDRGFLVVRVENDAPPAPAPRRTHAFEEHGWGLSIVESLARTHDGRLEITRLPGRFCATVWLAAH